jgi:hypothetical protein
MSWPLPTLFFPCEYPPGLLEPENKGNMILPIIRNYSPSDNAVISRRFESSSSK